MTKLKQLVEADALKSPSERIDSVQWNVDGYEPTEEMWQTLNEPSSPKHLKIVGRCPEVCNLIEGPSISMERQVSLRSLSLVSLTRFHGKPARCILPNIFP
jgi:hypothetical protein